jgi:hypothetical protein
MRSGVAKKEHPNLQINNVVTLATRVRICILRVSYFSFINPIY